MYVIALLLLSTLTGKTDIFTKIESVKHEGSQGRQASHRYKDESLNFIMLVIIIHELQCV